ncbi:hypothetical protein CONLIGDRAFT_146567 [Coniochaeta ligniaria NRRL 30616]|uniref:Heterokaryon incompatibility domain-containing protein n=1 Tax=Coniochaeta ligniaria NRRL 30616 TaxID=1408157 RepID=A0A1J7I6G6_9PEZI|nr:hypothetical protein CONLIGDRAFT_146567 [Coniochaeta ligniaria NRRL 30616]
MEGQTATSAEPTYELPSPTSIRLLKITHAHIPEEGERSVWFTISCFELDEAPEYLALSYTWTDPMRPDIFSTDESAPGVSVQATGASGPADASSQCLDDTPAFIGDRKYRATKNLRDGLAQILLSGLGSNWIWADAVCIDQENDAEKEIQVGMMDEVYSRAMAVVVWLGAETSDLEEFAWIHGEFFDALNKFIVEQGVDAILGQQALDPAFTSRLGVEPPGGSWTTVWHKYLSFCRRRRWFSRAWIVQEVTLARHVIVLCGPKDIEWDRMVMMAQMVVLLRWQTQVGVGVDKGFGRALGDEVIRLSTAKQKMILIVAMATPSDSDNKECPGDADAASTTSIRGNTTSGKDEQRQKWFTGFLELLLHTRVYSATDPRDKIYSLIGILKKILPPGMEMPFRPDYSEETSPRTLFTSITSMLLRELPNLKALSLVEDRASRKIKDLPSWVPDYTCHLTGSPLTIVRNSQHAFNCDPATSDSHDGSDVCRVSDDQLVVHGAEFDSIVAIASPMWQVVRTQVIDDCLALCENLSPEYLQTHTGPGEVLWRTMAANTFEQEEAPASLATNFKSWVSARLATQITLKSLQCDDATGQVTLIGFEEVLDEVAVTHSLDILTRLRAKDNENIQHESTCIPSIEEILEVARQMYDVQLRYILAEQGISFIDPPVPELDIEEATMRIEGEAAAFKHAISPVLPSRRLFRTAKGYLGHGPASIEPGDRVYLLRGAKVPFVLRGGEEGKFELMGETYVHGFMDGEMRTRVGNSLSEITLV